MPTENPITMTAPEAASFLRLSPSTLAKLRLYGTGPLYLKVGRRVLYRLADLVSWLDTIATQDTSSAEKDRLSEGLTAPPFGGRKR